MNGSVLINGGNDITTTSDVNLSLYADNAEGGSEMYLTTTEGCTDGGLWETFISQRSWPLQLPSFQLFTIRKPWLQTIVPLDFLTW